MILCVLESKCAVAAYTAFKNKVNTWIVGCFSDRQSLSLTGGMSQCYPGHLFDIVPPF